MKKKSVLIFIALLVITLSPLISSSSEDHHFSWWGLFSKIINSTLLFGGLYFFLRKPLSKYFGKKSNDVKNDIIEREKLLEKTTGKLNEIKKRLVLIEDEVKIMKENAHSDGEKEKVHLQVAGRKEVERLVALTESEIDNRVEGAVQKLKERIADLTIEHFKKDIITQLDKDQQEKIIEKNISLIGETIDGN